jgi:signal transduction histidine kinase/HAMP domain-containing protein
MTSVGGVAASPQRKKPPQIAAGLRSVLGIFNNLSIQIKASIASVLLLICLLGLGANAYLTSTRSAEGLRVLTNELIPKQQAFSQANEAVVATHMKIFRYVSWASNGVSHTLLDPLHAEINADLDKLSYRIAALARRPDLSASERKSMQELLSQWQICKEHAKDTIDVGESDAAMATMMLGQTDETFKAVDATFQDLSNAISETARGLSNRLYSDAEVNKNLVILVTIIGFLISGFVAIIVGQSIVRPIEAVTDAMQRLSAGEIDVEVGHGHRRDEIGRMVEAIEVFRKNIIDRHAMEQTLTEAIEAISEGFALYDADDRIAVCNTRYREMFSYGRETSMVGTPFQTIVANAVGLIEDAQIDPARWIAERVAAHRNPGAPHLQHRSDGRWIRVSERRTAPGGVVATYGDITELKHRETELDNLVHEIAVARDAAETANRAKSQFLANMSHELRTPLNAILGYTELMAEGTYGELCEEMLEVLKRLETNGRHLLGLINDVLDLSKIEAGQLVLELSDYCIQDIAQTVRSTLEPLAADKKLAFKVEVPAELPPGRGDGRRLTQVLINLVGNAIKFTDAGEVAIKTEANNGSFYVTVRDTGPGISAADQAKLFQEFQQADNAIARKKGGTGLGLAISKRIIEMHGGRIWVESQPGHGSTFAFTLPVTVERQVGTS